MKFLNYLFDHKYPRLLNLGQICMRLDNTGNTNKLNADELNISYTYDLSEYDAQVQKPEDWVEYPCTIEYEMKAENKDVPEVFYHYRGNFNAVGSMRLEQRSGTLLTRPGKGYSQIDPVEEQREDFQKNSEIQEFKWQLENRGGSDPSQYVVDIRCHYQEKSNAHFTDEIIFYPRQFAKQIKAVTFTFRFYSRRRVLKEVSFYKIGSNGKQFEDVSVSVPKAEGNDYKYSFQPDCGKCVAYYFLVRYDVSTEQV